MPDFATCSYCLNLMHSWRTECPFCNTPRDPGHPDGGVREPRSPVPAGPPPAVKELVPS